MTNEQMANDQMVNIPTIAQLKQLVLHLQGVIFPDYYPAVEAPKDLVLPEEFQAQIPEIARLINTDVDAVLHNDPAVTDRGEVILSYPLQYAMIHYRTAHALYKLGVPRIPRMLTELAHSRTGIDIHPAAQIGDHFCIDHGTGVVIGETAIIGSHVVLYQGVTLGAKNFEYDEEGRPKDIPRHPILEDHVTVYSNTSILGRVTIGHDTVIGGNIWLTQDIPANSIVLQSTPEIRIKTK
ncbi:MAG: serine acetyltransferase [Paludibacteraceae bacterium]|nr:serine acetyltransferase [Paludibacteraceae bacterium]